MLSLFAFAWMMSTYTLFYLQNGVRSAMTSRHGAWMLAHDPHPLLPLSANDIDDEFRMDPFIASVKSTANVPLNIPGAFSVLEQYATSVVYQVAAAETGFDVAAGSGTPYIGLRMQFPLMQEPLSQSNPHLNQFYETSKWPLMTELFENQLRLVEYAALIGL